MRHPNQPPNRQAALRIYYVNVQIERVRRRRKEFHFLRDSFGEREDVGTVGMCHGTHRNVDLRILIPLTIIHHSPLKKLLTCVSVKKSRSLMHITLLSHPPPQPAFIYE